MKILVDECLPKKIKIYLKQHKTYTVQEMGWASISNGRLIKLAVENRFNIFITSDKNLEFQQNLYKYNLAFIILDIPMNTMEYILPLIDKIEKTLETAAKGNVYKLK